MEPSKKTIKRKRQRVQQRERAFLRKVEELEQRVKIVAVPTLQELE